MTLSMVELAVLWASVILAMTYYSLPDYSYWNRIGQLEFARHDCVYMTASATREVSYLWLRSKGKGCECRRESCQLCHIALIQTQTAVLENLHKWRKQPIKDMCAFIDDSS